MPKFLQNIDPSELLPRHRHRQAYAAVVVSGGHLESGDAGRRLLREGDVAFHRDYEAHANRVLRSGARLLNLPLESPLASCSFAQLDDLDRVIVTAESDPKAAAEMLCLMSSSVPRDLADWPDMLAADLHGLTSVSLEEWAERHSLTPSAVSRGFRQVFGTSPKRYRLEVRTVEALERVRFSATAIADIAVEAGFADQAHMTRSLRALTGRTPGEWRKDKSVQASWGSMCNLSP